MFGISVFTFTRSRVGFFPLLARNVSSYWFLKLKLTSCKYGDINRASDAEVIGGTARFLDKHIQASLPQVAAEETASHAPCPGRIDRINDEPAPLRAINRFLKVGIGERDCRRERRFRW